MEWTKASIETTSPNVEIVTGILMSCGITGVEIIDAQERAQFLADRTSTWDYADEHLLVADSDKAYVVFYVTKDKNGEELLTQITNKLATFAEETIIRKESANDETWLNEWKKHFKPIRIGKVIVVPEWETYVPENKHDIIFKIDPGTAFGTGQHQTTKLCTEAVQKWVKPEDRVIDIGCGSGILSIISLLLGASYVYAIDIDPAGAIAATKMNAELNPIDITKLDIASGDVISDENARDKAGKNYDVVIANIVADVIIPLAPVAKELLKPGGIFVTSGIITERLDDVLAAFQSAGVTVIDRHEMEGWNSIVGRVE